MCTAAMGSTDMEHMYPCIASTACNSLRILPASQNHSTRGTEFSHHTCHTARQNLRGRAQSRYKRGILSLHSYCLHNWFNYNNYIWLYKYIKVSHIPVLDRAVDPVQPGFQPVSPGYIEKFITNTIKYYIMLFKERLLFLQHVLSESSLHTVFNGRRPSPTCVNQNQYRQRPKTDSMKMF
jgi:hypothetical protein